MTQNRRQDAIDGFRGNKYDILVATDIAARGIDVSDISHVINFDMPDTVDAYTHRIGRTGRAEQTGEAFTLAAAGRRDRWCARSRRVLGEPIERRRLADFDYGGFNPDARAKGNGNGWEWERQGCSPAVERKRPPTRRFRPTAERHEPERGAPLASRWLRFPSGN